MLRRLLFLEYALLLEQRHSIPTEPLAWSFLDPWPRADTGHPLSHWILIKTRRSGACSWPLSAQEIVVRLRGEEHPEGSPRVRVYESYISLSCPYYYIIIIIHIYHYRIRIYNDSSWRPDAGSSSTLDRGLVVTHVHKECYISCKFIYLWIDSFLGLRKVSRIHGLEWLRKSWLQIPWEILSDSTKKPSRKSWCLCEQANGSTFVRRNNRPAPSPRIGQETRREESQMALGQDHVSSLLYFCALNLTRESLSLTYKAAGGCGADGEESLSSVATVR